MKQSSDNQLQPVPDALPPQGSRGRWLLVLGLEYHPEGHFWERDSGLLCRGMRECGYDAWLVTLGPKTCQHTDCPLITGTLSDWENPEWWRQWNAVGVVANLWALPRFAGVARAIREAGLFHLARLDSNGLRTPRVDYWAFFRFRYSWMVDEGKPLPGLQAFLRSTIAWLFPRWHGRGTIEYLRYADVITVEAPISKQRYCRFLEAAGAPELRARIRLLYHPVTEDMVYSPDVPKEKMLLSVGRWNTHVKGPDRMVTVLEAVLSRRPDYRAVLIGSGSDYLEALRARLPQDVQRRIAIHGRVNHNELVRFYQRAQIVLNTSVTESFCLALAEGLCCGASICGPVSIPAFHQFASCRSGTLAESRATHHLSDALMAEIEAWENGERDPVAISEFWQRQFHSRHIIRKIIDLWKQSR